MLFQCASCGGAHCPDHRLPDAHGCARPDDGDESSGADTCARCGSGALLFECDDCGGHFCADHRRPEDHDRPAGERSVGGRWLGPGLSLGIASGLVASIPSQDAVRTEVARRSLQLRSGAGRWSTLLRARARGGYRWLSVRAVAGAHRLRSESRPALERCRDRALVGMAWLRTRSGRLVETGRRRSSVLASVAVDRIADARTRLHSVLDGVPLVDRSLDSASDYLDEARSTALAIASRAEALARELATDARRLFDPGTGDDGEGSGTTAWPDDGDSDGALPVGRRAALVFGATVTVSAATALQLGQPPEETDGGNEDPFGDVSFGYGGSPLNASSIDGSSPPSGPPTENDPDADAGTITTTAITTAATGAPTPTPDSTGDGGGGGGGGGSSGGSSGGGGGDNTDGGGGGGFSTPTETPTPTPTETSTPTPTSTETPTPTTTTTATPTTTTTATPTTTPEDEYGLQGYGQYGYGG